MTACRQQVTWRNATDSSALITGTWTQVYTVEYLHCWTPQDSSACSSVAVAEITWNGAAR